MADDALRGLFRDVAPDIKNANQYLKEFGRNFGNLIVDMLSQKAAAGLLTGLFGGTALGNFLSGGVQENEKGGVMYGARPTMSRTT